LRSREYDRELTVGSQTTTITQRVWEIRIDQIINLDRVPDRNERPSPAEAPGFRR
jgi:hypothetical protein